MSKMTMHQKVDYIWTSSRWRLVAMVVAVIGVTILVTLNKSLIPGFDDKVLFDYKSVVAAAISLGVAIFGLLGFSLLLNVIIKVFKLKINFHPDDYNVSSGVTEAVTTPGLRIPFAISGFIINPIGEELFFRLLVLGYLSGLFVNLDFNETQSAVLASLISVLAYCLLARKTKEIMEFIIIATIGLICSYLYLEKGIWYSFAANGGFVLGIYLTTAAFYYLDSKSSVQKKEHVTVAKEKATAPPEAE